MATKQTIAELLVEIGVDAKDAERAAARVEKKLKDVGKAGEKADKGVGKAEARLKKFAKAGAAANRVANGIAKGLLAASAAVVGIGKAVVGTGAKFETLKVQLETTTGSVEGAEKAFKFIKNFAKNTPFQVEQITESFVKLNNFGIEPTKRTLTAFGDFASAFGISLDQMVEAVTDATTGEFERLKKLGIKTNAQGENIKFTFRGVTTEVAKDAKAIEGFLLGLAEQNFGGAMAKEMQTAGGMVSNLKDAFTEFMNTVANMGPLEEFKKLVKDLQKVAGDKQGGLAKALADLLVKAIRKVREVLRGNLIPTLSKLVDILAFVVDNFGTLVTLFAGAKFASAVSSVVTGMTQMGIASAGALGPIGLIIAALGVLIPLALKAGDALGDVLAKERGIARTKKRAAPKTTTKLTTAEGQIAAKSQSFRSRELFTASKKLESLKSAGASDFDIDLQSLDVQKKQALFLKAERRVQRERDRIGAEEARKVAGTAAIAEAQRLSSELDTSIRSQRFEDAETELLESLIGGDITKLKGRKAAQFERGKEILVQTGGDVDAAKKAARRFSGGGSKRGAAASKRKAKAEERELKQAKADRLALPPVSVGDFLARAQEGTLGNIAAQTPRTTDIEPSVAIDITNNNFSFQDTFHITGQTDPAGTGKTVIAKIKAEFDRRTFQAGNSMPANLVR